MSSAEHMAHTLMIRTMRKHFNAYCAYIANYKVSKRCLRKILHRLNVWIKKRTLKDWKQNSELKRIWMLENKINDQVGDIDDKNKYIGEREKAEED